MGQQPAHDQLARIERALARIEAASARLATPSRTLFERMSVTQSQTSDELERLRGANARLRDTVQSAIGRIDRLIEGQG